MKAPFRLALRVEGAWWNAYLAKNETMDGAVLLGSIRMAAIEANAERKDAFMELMKGVLTDGLSGIGISWPNPPVQAPEHERSGSA